MCPLLLLSPPPTLLLLLLLASLLLLRWWTRHLQLHPPLLRLPIPLQLHRHSLALWRAPLLLQLPLLLPLLLPPPP